MALISKYKLVWECKSPTRFGFTVQQVNIEFVCKCGNTITYCMSWEKSEKFELQSTCLCDPDQILDVKAKRNYYYEDTTVAVMAVDGEFRIKKRVMWKTYYVVHEDGSSFRFNTDENGSYLITGKEKKLKGKGKRKPTPMKVKRSRGESDRAVDDYDISQYNQEERDEYESPKEDDYDDSYDPQDFVKSGPNDKDGYPPEFEGEEVVKKSLGDVDKKKSKADGSGVDENKEETGVVGLRIFIRSL